MLQSLLLAKETEKGFTWTLASRLGDMLTHAQEKYGPRDRDYTILGIEFAEDGPMIWYPGSNKNVVIQLSSGAMESEKIALYQLAHESIHLLSPTGLASANVLEEGLATYFSWWYLEHALNIDGKKVTNSPTYQTAGLLVEKLLNGAPSFFLEARQEFKLSSMNKKEIAQFCSHLSDDEMTLLARPFSEFSNFTQSVLIQEPFQTH